MAIITVGPSGKDYTKIQQGVDAAQSGDTVVVYGNVEYFEAVKVSTGNITIQANAGDSPYLNGRVDQTGYTGKTPGNALPQAGTWIIRDECPKAYKHSDLASLLSIDVGVNNVTWDGIDIHRSTGRGVTVQGQYFTIKNCRIFYCRGAAIQNLNGHDMEMDNVEVDQNVQFYHDFKYVEHPGAVSIRGGDRAFIHHCHFHDNDGEELMIDTNYWGAQDATIEDCIIGDGREAVLYVHGTSNLTVKRSIFYISKDRAGRLGGYNHVVNVKGIEKQYSDDSPPIAGSFDISFENCFFVGAPFIFGGNQFPDGSSFGQVQGLTIDSCTFANPRGGYCISRGTTNYPYSQTWVKGCVLFTTGTVAISGLQDSGIILQNNYSNKALPTYAYHSGNKIGTNHNLQNPAAAITLAGPNVNNYLLKSDSGLLVGANTTAVTTEDYFGNTRPSPSDLGAHDFGATGGGSDPGDPEAEFTMQVSSVDVTVIDKGTTVTFTDTSTPASGQSISSRLWTIQLPGVFNLLDLYTTTPVNYQFNNAGTWQIDLEVTQSDAKVSTIRKFLVVNDDVIEPPPPDPENLECGFSKWQFVNRQGSCSYSNIDKVLYIQTNSGDQGDYISYWDKDPVPAEDVILTFNYKQSMSTGNAAALIHYYNASGVIITSTSAALSNQASWTAYSRQETIPDNTVKIRVDIRSWGTVGEVWVDTPCLKFDTALAAPTAVIDAEVSSASVTSPYETSAPVTINFDGTSSTGTSLTYKWRLSKQEGGTFEPQGLAIVASTYDLELSQPGSYRVDLEVIQSDNQTATAVFLVSVTEEPVDNYQVHLLIYNEDRDDYIFPGYEQLAPINLSIYVIGDTLDIHFEIDRISYYLLDDEQNVLMSTLIANRDLNWQLTLPNNYTQGKVSFGIKASVRFYSGVIRDVSVLNAVEILEPESPVIGPTAPMDVSPMTQNSITLDGKHTHHLLTTKTGEYGKVPILDDNGVFIASWFSTGTDYDQIILRGGYSAYLDRGIIFGGANAWLTAQEINLDTINLLAPKLPQHDPGIEGQLWVDTTAGNVIKVSDGVPYQEPGGGTLITRYLQSGSADGAELSSTAMSLTQTLLHLETGYTRLGFHYTGIAVPNAATISRASIWINVHSQTTEIHMDVGLDDADNSAALSTTAGDLTNRSITTAQTAVDVTSITTGWMEIDITDAVQEVVDRGSWASGNAITVLFVYNTACNLDMVAYDLYAGTSAAYLEIEYTT